MLALVLLLVLGSPWGIAAVVVGGVLFLGELVFWNRTVRGRKPQVGAATLIGTSAKVVTACRPDGLVRVEGETWTARCTAGADPGDAVVVRALEDDLTLVVERTTAT